MNTTMEVRKWEDMESDCLVNIFQKVGLEELILTLPFVCKSWSSSSLNPLCWKTIHFQSLDFMPWTKLSKRFSSLYPLSFFSLSSFLKYAIHHSHQLVVEVRFPILFGTSLHDLVHVSNECQRTKTLALPQLRLEDEAHLPKLVGMLKELEFLEMEAKPTSFVELAAQISINCTKFKGLRMCGAIKKKDAEAIVNHLPNVKHVDLCKSYLHKEELLVIVNGCKEIERLSVKDCTGFQSKDAEVLKMVEKIRIFEDEGSKLVDDFGYETDDCDPFHVCVI